MASSKEYLEYITEQLGGADNDITYRAMISQIYEELPKPKPKKKKKSE